MRRPRRASAWRALATGLLLALGIGAGPASAHGGDVILSIGADDTGVVSVHVTYKTDGHAVEELVDVMVTAVSDAGDEVGPIQLSSATGDVGWYSSPAGALADGRWTVTATSTTPVAVTASSLVDVNPAPEPPAPDGDVSREDAAAAPDPTRTSCGI